LYQSSHFSFIVEEALKNDIHLETSMPMILKLLKNFMKERRSAKTLILSATALNKKIIPGELLTC
jgi:hypothetical protein